MSSRAERSAPDRPRASFDEPSHTEGGETSSRPRAQVDRRSSPPPLPQPVAPPAEWTIEDARQLYNIEGWGIGYFDINEHGHVTVHPTKEPERGLDLYDLAFNLQAQGVGLPILLRFPDIIRTRIETLVSRF